MLVALWKDKIRIFVIVIAWKDIGTKHVVYQNILLICTKHRKRMLKPTSSLMNLNLLFMAYMINFILILQISLLIMTMGNEKIEIACGNRFLPATFNRCPSIFIYATNNIHHLHFSMHIVGILKHDMSMNNQHKSCWIHFLSQDHLLLSKKTTWFICLL